ncbi:MAG: hypothetical protein Q8N48_00190 [Thiobacillus sp.]|nr:hypothetical protein [Thiobacillus sp.]MDP2977230.1 hypothetical protein [Thiobacillus sp.]
MKPTIEPIPPDAIKRRVFGIHSWPLAGAGDVAVHEAGHVVVALSLGGLPVYGARIAPDGATGQAGVLSPVGETVATAATLPPPEHVADIYRQAAPLVWPDLPPAEAALNYAVMLVAGRQAELIAAGIRLGGELRIHDADHQWGRAILAAAEMRLAMTWAQRMARHLLTCRWPEVEAIAAELRATGTWTNPDAWVRQSRNPSTTG